MTTDRHAPTRPRRVFWALTLVATGAAGSLSSALHSPAGTLTGTRVAVSGLILLAATALAARVLVVLERARRRRWSPPAPR